MLRKKLTELQFRIKVRKALTDQTNECVIITYEEVKREMTRRKILQK